MLHDRKQTPFPLDLASLPPIPQITTEVPGGFQNSPQTAQAEASAL